jgi:hypothetical protein
MTTEHDLEMVSAIREIRLLAVRLQDARDGETALKISAELREKIQQVEAIWNLRELRRRGW